MKATGGAIAAGRVLELATLVRAAESQSRRCLSPLKPGRSVTSRAVVTRRELVNFSLNGKQVQLSQSRFAHNTTFEQAFPDGLHGIKRPVDLKFGPDDCAYLVDYGAVRDFGQSDPASKFIDPGDGPLVQIPGTRAIWKICRAP